MVNTARELVDSGMGMRLAFLLSAVTFAMMQTAADEPVTAWADATIAVDTADFRIAVAPKSLRCSPDWCTGGTNVPGATYAISAVTDPDTPQAVTSSVPVSAASAEGDVTYGASGYVRFIMKALVGGTPVGETLTSDVSFGASGMAAAATFADSRTNSLQEVLDASGTANLTYSALWADNAAAVTLSAVKLAGQGGAATSTNALFTTAGPLAEGVAPLRGGAAEPHPPPAEGVAPLRGGAKGWWKLLCQVTDGTGGVLLEYLTDEFRRRGGITVNFR